MSKYEAPDPDDRPQVSLLTGFLGSGKTTLLNNLVKHPDMGETAVLINEFGDIGIDHQLVEQVDENMVLLNSGCLCCTVQGDLERALTELFLKRAQGEIPPFKRALIETTGLADPAPIIHALMQDRLISSRYELDAVITTVDAVNGDMQLDRYKESIKQAAVADRILLTKSDLAKQEDIEKLVAGLRELNPAAPIIHVAHGKIDPGKLFDVGLYNPETKSLDVQRWLNEEAYLAREKGHHHGHDHDHGHGHHDHDHGDADAARGQDPHDVNRHDEHIRSFSMSFEEPFAWDVLVAWVRRLIEQHGDDMLRVKGIIHLAGQPAPIAIHGVQHLFHDPIPLEDWPDDDKRSRIVFITRDLDRKTIDDALAEARKSVSAG